MITLKKISHLFYVFCILQWPSLMGVDSATSASLNQASYGAANGDLSKDASSGLLTTIYRKSRQSRCVSCYDDKYDDRSRYYGSYSSRSGDDRSGNWYYPRYDRYNDDRYWGRDSDYDRYGGDRYGYRDDRYDSRMPYDRYDTRGYSRYSDRRGSYDRGESRGYGYDNRDRYYGSERGGDSYRDRYYDRPRYGQSGSPGYGYDRDYHDRYSSRYEFRNYRPWDETYRGQSGYDSSGRGYYYAKGAQEDRRYLPEPSYRPRSPCGVPNCPQEGGTRVTSGPIDSGSYNKGYSQSTYNSNSPQNDSSKGTGSGWSYMREDESNQQPPRAGNGNNGGSGGGGGGSSSASSRDRNRDQQSPAYGALLDRGSNLVAVEPAKAADDAQQNAEKTPSSHSSDDDNQSHNASGQNS